jgi:hypothetical protein
MPGTCPENGSPHPIIAAEAGRAPEHRGDAQRWRGERLRGRVDGALRHHRRRLERHQHLVVHQPHHADVDERRGGTTQASRTRKRPDAGP